MRLRCVVCAATYAASKVRYRCDCGATLDVVHDFPGDLSLADFDARLASKAPLDRSGVWRFRELVAPLDPGAVATRREGNTGLYASDRITAYVGVSLRLKHEGENPTGSFKDRGMTVAVSVARQLGMTHVACASTGNTSASMAAYAAGAGMKALVFVPAGNVALGKLGQALAYGARTISISGDFDEAMRLVEQVCARRDVYLVNSINPFRVEGQKAIAFELLQDLDWEVPDWIALPGGNLGNSSAIAKGLVELKALGLIGRLPRMAVVQAAGANPLYTAWRAGADLVPVRAETRATAIRIGDPVSWRKCLRGLRETDGVVTEVDDQAILDAKAQVDAAGIGAEPASCATVAGVKRLVAEGVIPADADVCGVLTGHVLKDPKVVVDYHTGQLDGVTSTYANPLVEVAADLDAVLRVVDNRG